MEHRCYLDYTCGVLDPLVGATSALTWVSMYSIAASAAARAQVWFSLQGEMSATVMYYPQQYVELIDVMRGRLLAGRPDSWAPNVKIGLQMNYNKLCACITEDAIHPDFETSLAKVEFRVLLFSMVSCALRVLGSWGMSTPAAPDITPGSVQCCPCPPCRSSISLISLVSSESLRPRSLSA